MPAMPNTIFFKSIRHRCLGFLSLFCLLFSLCANAQSITFSGKGFSTWTSCDLNKDGLPDMVLGMYQSVGGVEIVLGSRNLDRAASSKISFEEQSTAIACGDINGDGNPDVVVGSSFNSDGGYQQLRIMLGDGKGGLTVSKQIPMPGLLIVSLLLTDVNRDGKMDIIAVTGGGLIVMKQDQAGNFAATTVSLNIAIGSAVLGDFNGDGKVDLAIAELSTGNIRIYLGDGAGGFAAGNVYATGRQYMTSILATDINHDGKLDIVAAGYYGLFLLTGKGDGTFAPASTLLLTPVDGAILAADMNGDGIVDLVVSTHGQICILPGTGSGGFSSVVFVPLHGASPTPAAIGDFNGDGKPDLAYFSAGNAYSGSDLTVLPGDGSLKFPRQPVTKLAPAGATYGGPVAALLGNFEGAGKLGMLIIDGQGYGSYYRPDSQGEWGPETALSPVLKGYNRQNISGVGTTYALTSYFAAVGDFNNDGYADFATATSLGILIYQNHLHGDFQEVSQGQNLYIPLPGSPGPIVTGDFNGDGKLDLAVIISDKNSISIFLGRGDGSFGAAGQLTTGRQPTALLAADFDGDGQLDLAVTNGSDNTVTIFRNTGGGPFAATFAATANLPTGATPISLTAGDFNGDGKLDLAIGNMDGNSISLLLGTGTGNFSVGETIKPSYDVFDTPFHPISLVAGDFDGDGRTDLAVATYDRASIAIFPGRGDGTFRTANNVSISDYGSTKILAEDVLATGHAELIAVSGDAVRFIPRRISSLPPLSKRGGRDLTGAGNDSLWLWTARSAVPVFVSRDFVPYINTGSQINSTTDMIPLGFVDFAGNGRSQLAEMAINSPATNIGTVNRYQHTSPLLGNTLRDVNVAWHVQAVGDLDGDGFGDMVFRFTGQTSNPADTGVSYIWFTDGSAVNQVRKRGGAPLSWTLLGAVDLNGDGAADMVYISPSGDIRILMATTGRTCANLSAGSLPAGFAALSVGDFSGRGKGDILIRNSSSGAAALLSLDATGITLPPPTADPDDPNASCTPSNSIIPYVTKALPSTDPAWQFYATGDFNGDGYRDILWKNADGTLRLWKMNENLATPSIFANIGTAPEGFTVLLP